MLNLFSTTSDTAGFRLKYMEIYNWGTFHEKIFRMAPEGNNALLTGANASGKSTWIDALLTLMVPAKKDRFYNQSSGVEKKGNRTEETYVLGHYGNIQREGDRGTTTQALRDHSAYSVLLACFDNCDQRTVTLFQVRWFSNGELRRSFGLAHRALEIQKDFQPFDGKGVWRRRLENTYKTTRQAVEFFDGPTGYAERLTQVFGMRSTKALSLFNQIVGVKVLDDLDEFIRTNMLEEQDAESQYIQLKESFNTLIEAKTNIEKARRQIEMLQPVGQAAQEIRKTEQRLKQLNTDKETAVYWFARKTIDLANERISLAEKNRKQLAQELKNLRDKEERLRNEERSLSLSIENDEIGRKIKEIEQDIHYLGELRDERLKQIDEYNRIAETIGFTSNPGRELFEQQRNKALQEAAARTETQETYIRESIALEQELQTVKAAIGECLTNIDSIKKNQNNIPLRETEIREDLLRLTGAGKEEIPFIGELLQIREAEIEWENSLEKVLRPFALHLIIPEKYISQVNEYLNRTELNGKIRYFCYRKYNSFGDLDTPNLPESSLLNKIEIRPDCLYGEWLHDTLLERFNYACVDSPEAFARYEKAVTREGLVKQANEWYEKDDRSHNNQKDNYILGWDHKNKILLLQQEIRTWQEKEKEVTSRMDCCSSQKQKQQQEYEAYRRLADSFTEYDRIDWSEYANRLQAKQEEKAELEKNNNKIQALQKQLDQVRDELHKIAQTDIEHKSREIFGTENIIEETNEELKRNQHLIASLKTVLLSDFEQNYDYLNRLEYGQIKQEQQQFRKQIDKEIGKLQNQKTTFENEAKIRIMEFKHPGEEITERFKDWRSDTDALPDANHIELIGEYLNLLERLEKENLPKYEQQFDRYLQKTLTDKVGEFRMFFMNWTDSIKENIQMLNDSLKDIDYRQQPATYIQLTAMPQVNEEAREFRKLMDEAIPQATLQAGTIDGRRTHFYDHIEPFMARLQDEDWRKKAMDVRTWFTYKAEEFNKHSGTKETTYENMGHLSGGEKAQLTYTILGSAIAYQFGLTKSGLQNNSFRFIAIDEAFKAQDEDKARYLLSLCRQLHLQLLVVTPNDNIHVVENDISFVYFVERKEEKTSWLYSMPIEQWKNHDLNAGM